MRHFPLQSQGQPRPDLYPGNRRALERGSHQFGEKRGKGRVIGIVDAG